MPLNTAKQKVGFFAVLGIGMMVGNTILRATWDGSDYPSVPPVVGSLLGLAVALVAVAIWMRFAKKAPR